MISQYSNKLQIKIALTNYSYINKKLYATMYFGCHANPTETTRVFSAYKIYQVLISIYGIYLPYLFNTFLNI